MEQSWIECETGYFFPHATSKSLSVLAKLEMLIIDELAKRLEEGIIIPFEKSVLISDEDATLLDMPPHNPYRFSIRTFGDLAHSNLKYILEILQPDGKPFVNPKINGAILHIDSDRIYRLNADQYQLHKFVKESNENVFKLTRQEVLPYNLLNAYNIQLHANNSNSVLDNNISPKNKKIIVADKLDVEISEINSNEYQVDPVILQKENGQLIPIDNEHIKDFQKVFGKYKNICSIYQGSDKTNYVCTREIQDGLKQIKKNNKLSKDEANRYIKQPREFLSGDVFDFTSRSKFYADDDSKWLPEEGIFNETIYSQRVDGIEEVKKSFFTSNTGHKIEWLAAEGDSEPTAIKDNVNTDVSESEDGINIDIINKGDTNNECDELTNNDENQVNDNGHSKIGKENNEENTNKVYALKIKPNFERIDFIKNNSIRERNFSYSALKNNVKLLPHQEHGIQWILQQWEAGYQGVLLADDMGLGKTLQTLAFLAGVKKSCVDYKQLNYPVLIVSPTALIKNWESEYKQFIQNNIFTSMIVLHGKEIKKYQINELTPNGKRKLKFQLPRNSIVLTTYETVRDYQFSLAEESWSIIVADEAQKIKNPTTGITLSIKAMKYEFAICLSGTPVENSWIDLWSIMDFVQPAFLKDLKTFKSKYIDSLKGVSGDKDKIEALGKKLKYELEPLFLRRMKKDHLNSIPNKNIYHCYEEMPTYQKNCYISLINTAQNNNMHPLQVIASLRDISLHPDLTTKPLNFFFEVDPNIIINKSARLIKTFAILENIKIRQEKVLIFLVSKKMQLILIHLIEEKFHIKLFNPINGTMNGSSRQVIVDKFNNSTGFNVLVLSPEAAGVGFTITSANNVIHLSRTWNPAKEDQATDRVYRIGQKKDVNVYLPIACHSEFGKGGSFDEKLDELLTYKRNLSENVLFPTADSYQDGVNIYKKMNINKNRKNQANIYWTIDDIDTVIGTVFERIVTDLYNAIPNYHAIKTPDSNDNGADVIVLENNKSSGFLIQCKHTESINKPIGKKAIQEVYTSVKFYENQKEYKGISFKPIAMTNAINFTNGAQELAKQSDVRLITRNELIRMIEKYNIPRCF